MGRRVLSNQDGATNMDEQAERRVSLSDRLLPVR
jgi:hypothetical protein